MANDGTLQISLFDAAGQPATSKAVTISIIRASGNETIKKITTSFPPPRDFALPAFPQEKALTAFVEATRFRGRFVAPFTLTHETPTVRNLQVFRLPSEWHARCTGWNGLAARFTHFKKVLAASPNVKVKGGKTYEDFTGAAYDGIDDGDARSLIAKVALLNLCAKLTELIEPVNKRKPWFQFVQRILVIDRERFVAVVDDDMAARARKIRNAIGQYKDYKKTPAGEHHGNMPAAWKVTKSSMFSIKTKEDKGNLQLTFGEGKHPETGERVFLLDTDIDENGKLMLHLADLFKHKITGGTHPFDIHDYLELSYKNIDLGYRLV